MLNKIHEGHLGITRCRDMAKQLIWWLGISSQLKYLVEFCPECIEERKNFKEPFVRDSFPERPWSKIALDLFKCKKWYLIVTDYYSRYFEFFSLKTLDEEAVIAKCKKIFSRLGIPEVVRTDPGTQFSSKFYRFAKEYDFCHIKSSPKYSQSNGCAEAAVKNAKRIIKKCKDVDKGLLSYRSTPLENGYSPAELLNNRKIRSLVPILPNKYGTFHDHKNVLIKEKEKKDKQEKNYNKKHKVKKLSIFETGDKVWVIDKQVYGEISAIDEKPNSYFIKLDNNRTISRNRWHLVPAPYKSKIVKKDVNIDPWIPNDYTAENKDHIVTNNFPGIVNNSLQENLTLPNVNLDTDNNVTQDQINAPDIDRDIVLLNNENNHFNPGEDRTETQEGNKRPMRNRKPNSKYTDFVCN